MNKKLQYDPLEAVDHLKAVDGTLGAFIERSGPLELKPGRHRTPFEALLRAIAYQQLSGKAAGTIHGRVLDLFPRGRPDPERLLTLPENRLREAGLSGAKTRAVRDLAEKALDGTVPSPRELGTMSDADILQRLIRVRGVGRWTVEMLLIFDLGRPDVLPLDDLGIQKGFRNLYAMKKLPAARTMNRRGRHWQPFRSVASWYLWKAADGAAAMD
jgi:3-methyladenine DNA glycosylase/8-oxoguanine DNA glycosylase